MLHSWLFFGDFDFDISDAMARDFLQFFSVLEVFGQLQTSLVVL